VKKPLPKLYQRTRDGQPFGAFYVNVRNKPINLRTNRADVARARRIQAVHNGSRQWPRDWDDTLVAKKPASPSRNPDEGAADRVIAALDGVAPQTSAPPPPGGAGEVPAGGGDAIGAPPPLADAPPPDPLPVVDAEPIGQSSWTSDVGAGAGASSAPPPEAAPPPRLRLQDFGWFQAALVTASKVAVGVQLHAQAWAMRMVGDVEAGRVGPPPVAVAPDGVENMAAFMAMASAPWAADDPRERGRQAYAQTIVALLPEELPVPAWLKWLEAPIITAIDTAPVQWQTGKKIERNPDGTPVEQAPPATSDGQPIEEPPGDVAAAA